MTPDEKDAENHYVQQRWQNLSDESRQLLARSLEERAFLVLMWRLAYRDWRYPNDDDPPWE